MKLPVLLSIDRGQSVNQINFPFDIRSDLTQATSYCFFNDTNFNLYTQVILSMEPTIDIIYHNSEARLDDDELLHGFVIDVRLRLIKLYYLNEYPGEPMVSEPVPDGVDMFNILNLTVPANVSSLTGWSVVISPNSSYYPKLLGFFGVSNYVPCAIFVTD